MPTIAFTPEQQLSSKPNLNPAEAHMAESYCDALWVTVNVGFAPISGFRNSYNISRQPTFERSAYLASQQAVRSNTRGRPWSLCDQKTREQGRLTIGICTLNRAGIGYAHFKQPSCPINTCVSSNWLPSPHGHCRNELLVE